MWLFEGHGIDVENPTFVFGERVILKYGNFQCKGGSRTGLAVRVLSKDLFCCFSTSSSVLISASLQLVLGKMENTSFVHDSLNDLQFVSCHTVNGIPITPCER